MALLPDLAAISPSATAVRAASSGVRQSSNEVLMVAPTAFGFNEQAAQVRGQRCPKQALRVWRRMARRCVCLGFCTCLDASAGPEPSYRACEAWGSRAWGLRRWHQG